MYIGRFNNLLFVVENVSLPSKIFCDLCVCVEGGGGGGGGGEGVRGMSNMGNLTGTVSRLDDDHKAHDI